MAGAVSEIKRIHLWVPDIESAKGGIQAFSRFFIRAVADAYPDADIAVFSKNDHSPPETPLHDRPIRFECAGWWIRGQRTIGFAWQIGRAALTERPDLILSTHVHFSRAASWLKSILGVRYAVVAHGVDVWDLRSRQLVRALRRADRLLAVSNFTRQRMLRDLGVSPDRIGLVPNTFDADEFRPEPKPHYLLKRFRLEAEQPVILTVARLASADRYKGYDQILRVLPAIKKVHPNIRYVIAGSGPDRKRIEGLIKELGLEENVTLAGYVPNHELCAFYNLCDVFAMPSKGEGFGIVFLEALGCGKPVVAGNKDGSVDAVANGKLGVLVDPDDLNEIREALILTLSRRHPLQILQDPERLRAEAIEKYGYARFAKTVKEEIGKVGG
jgi:glycosyltransferase involved in cell wall biosynthesis